MNKPKLNKRDLEKQKAIDRMKKAAMTPDNKNWRNTFIQLYHEVKGHDVSILNLEERIRVLRLNWASEKDNKKAVQMDYEIKMCELELRMAKLQRIAMRDHLLALVKDAGLTVREVLVKLEDLEAVQSEALKKSEGAEEVGVG